MDRDYKDEQRQSDHYVRELLRRPSYEPALLENEYSQELLDFEKEVLEDEGLWNTCNYGYTLEFSTSKQFFEEKMQILSRSSHRLDRGVWNTMRCSTCEEHNPDTPIHVEIRPCLNDEERRDSVLREFKVMQILRKKYAKGTGVFNLDTIGALLETLDPKLDMAIELSLALDEAVEIQSHIVRYD